MGERGRGSRGLSGVRGGRSYGRGERPRRGRKGTREEGRGRRGKRGFDCPSRGGRTGWGAGARPSARIAGLVVEELVWHPTGVFVGRQATRGADKGETRVALIGVHLVVIKLGVTIGFRTGKEGTLVESFGSKHATTFMAAARRDSSGLVNDANWG